MAPHINQPRSLRGREKKTQSKPSPHSQRSPNPIFNALEIIPDRDLFRFISILLRLPDTASPKHETKFSYASTTLSFTLSSTFFGGVWLSPKNIFFLPKLLGLRRNMRNGQLLPSRPRYSSTTTRRTELLILEIILHVSKKACLKIIFGRAGLGGRGV